MTRSLREITMKQDPSIPYVFYTQHGEHITIRVKAIRTSPLVEGAGPPSFFAHPPDPNTNTRTFEFTEANPPDVDSVELVFSFIAATAKTKYTVTLTSSVGGTAHSLPDVTHVPGLTFQHLGILFLANSEAAI